MKGAPQLHYNILFLWEMHLKKVWCTLEAKHKAFE